MTEGQLPVCARRGKSKRTKTEERADGKELTVILSVDRTNLEDTDNEHVDNPMPKLHQICGLAIAGRSWITWAISFPSNHQRYRRQQRQQNGREG